MFDEVANGAVVVVPGVAAVIVETGAVSELTGTGISVPEAMIAFLLLLVKTVGREIVLNLPVESRACTMAARVLPAAR